MMLYFTEPTNEPTKVTTYNMIISYFYYIHYNTETQILKLRQKSLQSQAV